MAYARRWGDNDFYFGPFTFASDTWKHWAIVLESRDDEDRGCSLRITLKRWTMIIALPDIIKPSRTWVDLSQMEWASGPGYWDIKPRAYGFSLCDGHLDIKLGRVTHDSSTEQRWGCFLPWTQWRHVRHSLYDLSGAHFWTEGNRMDFDAWHMAKEECPAAVFIFNDFDGEQIEAKTIISEREWRFGEGRFKWLSWFRRARVTRSMGIEFSKETGKRKGSWKGGTLGHSIEMLDGELHEAAFQRYCAEHNMTFISRNLGSA